MAKTCIGIDVGASALKLCVCKGDAIQSLQSAQTPDNLVNESGVLSPAALSDLIRETAREKGVPRGSCAVALPPAEAFFRRTTMPAMAEDTLKVNLPYEFRDFITAERDKYVFDYSMVRMNLDENGAPQSMDLMAAAALKSTIETWRDVLRHAGFKLELAAPEEIAYANILRGYEARNPAEEKREYCILDVGHTASRLYFYTGTAHEASRVIDYGGQLLDAAIAEHCNVDEHIAATYKLSNYQDVLNLPACLGIYTSLSIELMQALNFYNYNNPENTLRDIYLCGGGANIAPLVEAIREKITLAVHSIGELMPPVREQDADAAALYPLAYGVTAGR